MSPGTRLDVDLEITERGDPATFIPVSVFHGAQPGPVLAITCGVHGFEFIPILAAQQVLAQIDPKEMSGTLILVRLAHVPAFQNRTIFFNPYDRKNLNRVFPGSPLGTQSQRIAHALSTEVIGRADLHVDMHGGDGTESLHTFAGYYAGRLAEAQAAKSKEMALSLGLNTVVEYQMDTWEQVNSGRSANRQAVAVGKPTVLFEIGEAGGRQPELVEQAATAMLNLLKGQKMLPGAPLRNKRVPAIFLSTASATARESGIWYPAVSAGASVKRGDVIGTVRDFLGVEREKILAPEQGMVLYMHSAPPVNAGESVATIARPQRGK